MSTEEQAPAIDRHMTVSGFVYHEGRVALHWHRKLQMWLPAGGHIEPGEDPLEAAVREVNEEFAVEVELLAPSARVQFDGGPRQIEPPYTILECWVSPDHCHVDNVYFFRLVSGYPGVSHDADYQIHWLDAEAITRGYAAIEGREVPFAPDVLALSLETIRQGDRLALTAAPQQR
ncbi:MAG: NUDIX domain-containing protein [Dehalococcoidia bacterium]